jgi:hypothetical protein
MTSVIHFALYLLLGLMVTLTAFVVICAIAATIVDVDVQDEPDYPNWDDEGDHR